MALPNIFNAPDPFGAFFIGGRQQRYIAQHLFGLFAASPAQATAQGLTGLSASIPQPFGNGTSLNSLTVSSLSNPFTGRTFEPIKPNETISKDYRFPKAEKLKSRKAIDKLFKAGSSFFVHPYKVFYQATTPASTETALQVGFAVSTRNFKKAVDRNRIKRIGREAYRLNKHALQQTLQEQGAGMQVFLIYTDKQLPVFHTIQKKMVTILDRLIKTREEQP